MDSRIWPGRDWAESLDRLLLLSGGLLLGAAAAAATPRGCRHPRTSEPWPRPVPLWTRLVTYAAAAVPILGFTMPHAAWLLHIHLGITAHTLAGIATIPLGIGIAISALPALGGVLTLGLAARWGQVFPGWMPLIGGRRVPPRLALVPAGVIAVAMVSYGLIGVTLMTRSLAGGSVTVSQLLQAWAVVMTELVFLLWGAVLATALLGYYLVTRPCCPLCQPVHEERPARRRPHPSPAA